MNIAEMQSLALCFAMLVIAADSVTAAPGDLQKGDLFQGIQHQKHEPVSTWEVRLRVLDVLDSHVKVRIDFLRQRFPDGKMVKVGLAHLSEGPFDGRQLSLECKQVNLREFAGNVGWKPLLQVEGAKISGTLFELTRTNKRPTPEIKPLEIAEGKGPGFFWFHDPRGQQTLDIENASPSREPRTLVHLPCNIIVQGERTRVSIPSPLHRFVQQHCLYSQVTASIGDRELVPAKDYSAALVVSEQGQPFFVVELYGVVGDVTIKTDSLVLLPAGQDQQKWEQRVATMRFVSPPAVVRVGGFQHQPPPVPWKAKTDQFVANGLTGIPGDSLRGLIHSVRYVHDLMKYEATVKNENPYAGLLDDSVGHCGIYATGVDAIGEQLEAKFGVELFKAGGYWGGPHVRNGAVLYATDGTRTRPVFLFADATQGRPLAPQGEHDFVVTSVAGYNTFNSATAQHFPSKTPPPNVPFDVNTMSTEDGRIVKWLPVKTRRLNLHEFPLTASIRTRLEKDLAANR
jgi:hypothetical protein